MISILFVCINYIIIIKFNARFLIIETKMKDYSNPLLINYQILCRYCIILSNKFKAVAFGLRFG